MNEENQSLKKDFLIVGFSDFPHLQVPLFAAFLLIYLLTLMGNILIIATVYSNSHLHTPMYFFLTSLSFNDVCYISVIFPQMLAHFFQEGTHVSFTECIIQMYFFMVMVVVEFLLLSTMAYDRYVAICNPLHYMTIMNTSVCVQLALGTWVSSFLIPLAHTVLFSHLSFCTNHTINHFFCDLTALLKISCSSTQTIETLTYVMGPILALTSLFLIIVSYIHITSSIMKIKSKEGRKKTFSTCVSHLTVVILFYGSLFGTYVRPTSSYTMRDNKISSLSYIAVTPLCNPIIYSLKNTTFKNALKKTMNAGQSKCRTTHSLF
ncbi:olfactory receptor 1G1-like [Lissotriton helveticus]